MAKNKRLAGLPSTAPNRAAGVAAMVRLAALSVSIGTGCTLPLVAAYAVIFLAGLIPALVAWRDSIPRPAVAARAEATTAAGERPPARRRIEGETSGGRLVSIEPDRHRLQ